ncbi:signal peptidase I [Desulfatibacillum aliphaticivorans]|uniref:Signal peptidase I n=1 Tax=Desulfatibacillum aliphaticivorans TaxID=218208 RepID=B8FN50_DESAL|nr:signal peptidase I [Desulfatibacillum aliphaticivorans]ACL06019.1 signal peptidase I [Desulfatibacillum aliphaticivorans]
MDSNTLTGKSRNGFAALGLSLALPGLGQVYNGEVIKGLCFFVLVMAAHFAGFALAVRLPDSRLFGGLLLTLSLVLLLYLGIAVEAFRTAKEISHAYILKPYNRVYLYAAVWVLGALLYLCIGQYTRANYVHFFKIPSHSMEPGVLAGDYVVADRLCYQHQSPQKGDVIVFVYPDDRSKVFMKRVAALPGDTVTLPGGRSEKVPHGRIFVLGDNPKGSLDSRKFGTVPLADVMGKIRVVYFSRGEDGVRWDRIGKIVGAVEDGQ